MLYKFQFQRRYEIEILKDVLDTYRNVSENYARLEEDSIKISYHVAMVTKPLNRSSLWCGGSIVSKTFILTAAHCLEGSNKTMVVLYKSTNSENNVEDTIESSLINRHPNWQPHLLLNDLALVELPRPLDLPDLSPIKISSATKIASRVITVYGWAKNSTNQPTLREIEVVVIKNKLCAKHYGSLITRFKMCTKAKGPGNVCHGFSGSGLVVDGVLVGVMSFGSDRCNDGYPAVYTKVSRYKKWIEKVLNT